MRLLLLTLLAVLAFGMCAAPSQAASLSLASSSDPTEDEPVSITATGVADTSQTLYLYGESGGTACSSTASQQANRPGVFSIGPYYGDPVSAGMFTRVQSFSPTTATTFRICGYVTGTSSGTPSASATTSVAVRLPTADVALSVSADPTEEEPVTVTAAGRSEASRSLYVYGELNGSSCSSTASQQANRPGVFSIGPYYGSSVSGSYSIVNDFTPSAAGSYRLCAYVVEQSSSAPLATTATTVAVRLPTADVAVSASADPTEEKPVTVTARGTSEASRTLYVYGELSGSSCSSTASQQSNRSGVFPIGPYYGTPARNGYSIVNDFTPSTSGLYRLCAYVVEQSSSTPLATTTLTVSVRKPSAALELTTSADPTEGEDVTVTAAGTSEGSRTVWLYGELGGTTCSTTASQQSNRAGVLPIGEYYGMSMSGTYSLGRSFTPASAGKYKLCAYLAEQSSDAPLALVDKDLDVRVPTVTFSDVSFGADPKEGTDVPVSLKVIAEQPVRLSVYAGTAACADTAGGYAHLNGTRQVSVNGGTESPAGEKTHAFTFKATPGTWNLCTYAIETSGTSTWAKHFSAVAVRKAAATIAFVTDRSPYLNEQRRPVTVTGWSELARRLVVFAAPGAASCPAEPPASATVREEPDPQATSTVHGQYSKTIEIEFDKAKTTLLCVRVGDAANPNAADSITFIKQPLAAPVSITPDRSRFVAGRTIAFQWTAQAGSDDQVEVRDANGERLFVGSKTGVLLEDRDLDIDDDEFDETFEDESDEESSARKAKAIDFVIAQQGPNMTAALGDTLPPGRYSWRVVRARDAGESSLATEARNFVVDGPTLRTLKVKVRSKKGRRSNSPGETRIAIQATPFASIRVELRRSGRTLVRRYRFDTSPRGTITLPWSCNRTGSPTYLYKVTASDSKGHKKSSSGRFTTVSTTKCRAMKKAENKALRDRVARRQAQERAAARAERQEARRRARLRTQECYARGGYVTYIESRGAYYCVNILGEFIPLIS